jgi:hypothetical protein
MHVLGTSTVAFEHSIDPATNSLSGSVSVSVYAITSGGDH